MENNKKLADELVELFVNKDKESFHKVAQEYINQISFNIGVAINPVNDLTLPFVVFALQEYIDTLKKGKEEYIETILKSLRADLETGVVIVPIRRGDVCESE